MARHLHAVHRMWNVSRYRGEPQAHPYQQETCKYVKCDCGLTNSINDFSTAADVLNRVFPGAKYNDSAVFSVAFIERLEFHYTDKKINVQIIRLKIKETSCKN